MLHRCGNEPVGVQTAEAAISGTKNHVEPAISCFFASRLRACRAAASEMPGPVRISDVAK